MAEKVRVIIVDDIAETRENIRKLLQFEPDVEVVGTARTGKEAISLANELKPDVILMDINMPDMDGITATEKIRQQLPWAQIVILSVQGDPNYMRRAMLAGARDFLTKPPNIDELIAAIRRAGKMAVEERNKAVPVVIAKSPGSGPLVSGGYGLPIEGSVFTVYSPKGGTGTTTVAVNLALALNENGKRVIVVDANLQYGNVSIFFNQQSKNHIGDLTARVDALEKEIVEEVAMTHDSGVKILAAPPRPELAADITDVQIGRLLDFLRQCYDYVVVDAPADLSDQTVAALDSSDLIVVLTTQDIPSVANCRVFFDVAVALGVTNRIVFVMNKYDKRVTITQERISANLKREFAASIPLDEKTVVTAVNKGVPFMLDPRNRTQPAGKGILDLAAALRRIVGERKK